MLYQMYLRSCWEPEMDYNDIDIPPFTLERVMDMVFGFFAALGLIGSIIMIGYFWGVTR